MSGGEHSGGSGGAASSPSIKEFGAPLARYIKAKEKGGEDLRKLAHDLEEHPHTPRTEVATHFINQIPDAHASTKEEIEDSFKKFLDLGKQVHAKIQWNQEKIQSNTEAKTRLQEERSERKYVPLAGRNIGSWVQYWWQTQVRDKPAEKPKNLWQAIKQNYLYRKSTGIGWFDRTRKYGRWLNPLAREHDYQSELLANENQLLKQLAVKWKGYLDEHEIAGIEAKHYNEDNNIYESLKEHNMGVNNWLSGITGIRNAPRELAVMAGEARKWRVGVNRSAENVLMASANAGDLNKRVTPWRRTRWATTGTRKEGVYTPPWLTERSRQVLGIPVLGTWGAVRGTARGGKKMVGKAGKILRRR